MLSPGHYTTGQIRTLETEERILNTNIKIKPVGSIYIYVLSCYHTLSLQFSFLHSEIESAESLWVINSYVYVAS